MYKHDLIRASLLLFAVLMAVTACTTPVEVPVVSCSLSSKNIDEAFDEAYSVLRKSECESSFNNVEEQLFTLAERSSGKQNYTRFGKFYDWSETIGLLSENDAERRFSIPFTVDYQPVFPNASSVCIEVRGKGYDEIKQRMFEALNKKERGLLKIMGDEEKWDRAKLRYAYLIDAAYEVKQERDCQ